MGEKTLVINGLFDVSPPTLQGTYLIVLIVLQCSILYKKLGGYMLLVKPLLWWGMPQDFYS